MRVTRQRRRHRLYATNPLPPALFDLQTALTAAGVTANATPGTSAVVTLPPGIVSIPSLVTWPDVTADGSEIVLNGVGIDATTLKMVSGFVGANMMKLSNTTLSNPWITEANPTTLAVITRGDTTITRTAGIAPTPGWYMIADDALWYDGITKWRAYLVKVTVVNGNTITLDAGTPHNFNVGTVQMWRVDSKVSRGARVKNLTIDGYVDGVGYMTTPLFAYALASFTLQNVRIKRFATSGIQLFRSRNLRRLGCTFDEMDPQYHATTGRGRGWDCYWSYDIISDAVLVNNLRHGTQYNACCDVTEPAGTATNCWGNNIDLHGQQSYNVAYSGWTSTPEPGLSASSLYAVRAGNETFKDWETGHSFSNMNLGGTDILCCGARQCSFTDIIAVRRLRFEGNTDADLGGSIYPQANTFTRVYCTGDATGTVIYGPSGGFKRATGQTFSYCFFGVPATAGAVPPINFDTIDGDSDFTFDHCWFDCSLATATKAILAQAAGVPTGTLTLTFSNCIFNLNSGADPFVQSQTNSPTIVVHFTNCVQCKASDLSFTLPVSLGNYTLGTNSGNVVYAAQAVPGTISATVAQIDAILAAAHE